MLRADSPARYRARILLVALGLPGPGHGVSQEFSKPAPRRPVVAPGLQQLRLHPVERLAHRLVVRAHHAALAEHQRLQRHRLRRRQREIEPRAVLVLAVAPAPQPNAGVGNEAREHLLEALRAHVSAKAKRRRPATVPESSPGGARGRSSP